MSDITASFDKACRLADSKNGGNYQSEAKLERRPKQADVLIELAQSAELFHRPDGTGFADIGIDGHRETWPIRSKAFKRWLAREFYQQEQGAPNSEAMQSALGVIEAKAHFDAPKRDVYVRVGGHDGKLYIDLADEAWRAIEIDTGGWRVIDIPPIRFRRAPGMQALPVPVRGGCVEALRSFLNVKTDDDFVLAVSWLLAAMRDRGPYPVLALAGEHGSAKSTFETILRALLDPNTAPLRALPRDDRDLFIAASNGHLLAFDNVSGLKPWISDTLCRLATGGGFATRQLYTDQDEVLFDAQRPVILNGIEDIVTRPDLADRTIFLTLEAIPEQRRRPEQELREAFERKRPSILGALLDLLGHGLRLWPHVRLGRMPRMADFAKWATACETAIWPAGTFMGAYDSSRNEAVAAVIEADVVATAVRDFMADRWEWEGTSSSLLDALGTLVAEKRDGKNWPDEQRALRGRLKRAAPFLRTLGIGVEFGGTGRRRRHIRIQAVPDNGGEDAVTLVTPSPCGTKYPDFNDVVTDGPVMVTTAAPTTVTPTVTSKGLKQNAGDGGDGGDGNCHLVSGDHRCDHCGRPASPANPLKPWDWPDRPAGVWLHPSCEEPWFDSDGQPVTADKWNSGPS
jgi:hypothetical protein